jgi:hypothetical protein
MIYPLLPFPPELIWKFRPYRQSVGRIALVTSRVATRYLRSITQTLKQWGQTSLPLVAFEPTVTVFKRAKALDALGGEAIAIGKCGTVSMDKETQSPLLFTKLRPRKCASPFVHAACLHCSSCRGLWLRRRGRRGWSIRVRQFGW